MNDDQSLKYIEKISLEIVNRPRFWFYRLCSRPTEKFNITKFNPREAAYAFLGQYNGQVFVKGQKIIFHYNNQNLHLYVRDLFYGKINQYSNSNVEFLYREIMFSEIKWPIKMINQIQWLNRNENEDLLKSKLIPSVESKMETPAKVPNIDISNDLSSNSVLEMQKNNTRKVPPILHKNIHNDQLDSIHSANSNTEISRLNIRSKQHNINDKNAKIIPNHFPRSIINKEDIKTDGDHFDSLIFNDQLEKPDDYQFHSLNINDEGAKTNRIYFHSAAINNKGAKPDENQNCSSIVNDENRFYSSINNDKDAKLDKEHSCSSIMKDEDSKSDENQFRSSIVDDECTNADEIHFHRSITKHKHGKTIGNRFRSLIINYEDAQPDEEHSCSSIMKDEDAKLDDNQYRSSIIKDADAESNENRFRSSIFLQIN